MRKYLRQAVTANGGTPASASRVGALREMVTAYGGSPTKHSTIDLLKEAITAAGGAPVSAHRNGLLSELAVALGGQATTNPEHALAYISGAAATSAELLGVKQQAGTAAQTISFADLNPQEGDVVYALAQFNGTSLGNLPPTTTGYTLQVNNGYYNPNSGISSRAVAYSKTLGAGETSVSFPSTGHGKAIFVYLLRGYAEAMDVAATVVSGINTDRANPAPITTATNGALVLVIGGGGYTVAGTLTNPSGYDAFYAQQVVSGGFSGSAASGYIAAPTAGLIDPLQFTGGANQHNSAFTAATIALKPA